MLIKNGIIATSERVFNGDILIKDGKIAQIGQNLPGDGEIADASGQYVLPGGVDVHTHFDLDVGIARATDDFYTGTVAAACGGTTSVVDHPGFGPAGCALRRQIDYYHALADGAAVIDYGFHGVVQRVDEGVLSELETLIGEGITSFKIYMTYDYKLDDASILRFLRRAGEYGLMTCVHPENDGVVNYLRSYYAGGGFTSPVYHAKSRPPECEAEAVSRFLLLARLAGDAPAYIVHLTNGLALDYIRRARALGQRRVYAETCPQYLFFDDAAYAREDGLKYVMSPPLRKKEDNAALWAGLSSEEIQTVATDHCPFNYNKEKQLGAADFTKCPNGAPGVETRLLAMFSEGYMKKRMTLNQVVRACCTNPARLFGLADKGDIAPGLDADIVMIDPAKERVISRANLHENVDYTLYEGMRLQGAITRVFSRGELIVKDNAFLGAKGRGRFIRRGLARG